MTAVSVQAKIAEAFFNDAGNISPALPIAFPNTIFEVGARPDRYLAVDVLFNTTRRITLGDDPQQLRGIFQVTVYWERAAGIIAPLNVAGGIVRHYGSAVLFTDDGTRITVSGEPWAASPLVTDDRISVPVTITWHAFEPET